MTEQYSEERREFLKTVALLAGVGVAAPAATKAIAAGKPVLLLPEQSSQGYKETVHIRKYYQSARN